MLGDVLHATLEPNDHNPDGCAPTFYFDGGPKSLAPAVEDVQDAVDANQHLCLAEEHSMASPTK